MYVVAVLDAWETLMIAVLWLRNRIQSWNDKENKFRSLREIEYIIDPERVLDHLGLTMKLCLV